MTEAQAAARKIRKILPQDVTVQLWLVGWREFFPSERTPESAQHDAYMLAPFIERHGRRLLSAVTALMAQEWANKHPAQVRYLREAWEKAYALRFVSFNVWSAVRLPRRSARPSRLPTTEQVDAAIATAHELGGWYDEFADLVTVAAYTGARSGGLSALGRAEVDLSTGRLQVTEKGSKTRTVALLGPSRDAAARAVERSARLYARYLERPDLVFRSRRGAVLNRAIIGSGWHAIRGDFDGPFHSLKHFAGTWLAEHGVDERDIAIQLGHTDAEGRPYTALVRRVYVHPDPDEALARIEEQIARAAA